jgi:hypothetical protein
MQVERSEQRDIENAAGAKGGVVFSVPERRRVRTGQRLLHREADRRRTRANFMVLVSFVGVLVLVKILYELLSR